MNPNLLSVFDFELSRGSIKSMVIHRLHQWRISIIGSLTQVTVLSLRSTVWERSQQDMSRIGIRSHDEHITICIIAFYFYFSLLQPYTFSCVLIRSLHFWFSYSAFNYTIGPCLVMYFHFIKQCICIYLP